MGREECVTAMRDGEARRAKPPCASGGVDQAAAETGRAPAPRASRALAVSLSPSRRTSQRVVHRIATVMVSAPKGSAHATRALVAPRAGS